MGIDDLKEAYKIECEVNPSPWKYETFLSSFEVGHKGLICKHDSKIIGFIIFSPINPEAHILSISVTNHQLFCAIFISYDSRYNRSIKKVSSRRSSCY